MGKKGPLWWRESDSLLRGSSAANQILLHHSGPILSHITDGVTLQMVLHCRWFHIVDSFTLQLVSHCKWSHITDGVTLQMVPHCRWFNIVDGSTLQMV